MRPKKEVDRQLRKGRTPDAFYCSNECCLAYYGRAKQEKPPKEPGISKGPRPGKFTHYLNKARNRPARGYVCDLDEAYLDDLWLNQGEKCALTGVIIFLRKGPKDPFVLRTASLDRISSDVGYIKGNVQFVAYGANLAKSDFTDSEFRDFLRAICDAQDEMNDEVEYRVEQDGMSQSPAPPSALM